MKTTLEPATLDQLVAHAAARGFQVTPRLIRDWSEKGLLDYPQRRGAGRGRGSQPALYTWQQREMLSVMLERRSGDGIQTLARLVVGMWAYFGEECVSAEQALRAFRTWLGDPRATRRQALRLAQTLVQQLDHPLASHDARRHLRATLAEGLYTGRFDARELEDAVRAVFEPGYGRVRRAVGHPTAPLTADTVLDLVDARLVAVQRVKVGVVSVEEFRTARDHLIASRVEYASEQPSLAAASPSGQPQMYELATLETAIDLACRDLLTMLGLIASQRERRTSWLSIDVPV